MAIHRDDTNQRELLRPSIGNARFDMPKVCVVKDIDEGGFQDIMFSGTNKENKNLVASLGSTVKDQIRGACNEFCVTATS